MKCEIPSFVTDFVSVINWSDNNNAEFYSSQNTMGKKTKKKIVWKKSFNTSLAGDTQALQVGDKKNVKAAYQTFLYAISLFKVQLFWDGQKMCNLSHGFDAYLVNVKP